MRDDPIGRATEAFRRMRGTWLVLMALPLAPALLLNLMAGDEREVVGTLLGIAGVALALRALRRGKVGPAAALVGVATGLLAALAGPVHPLAAVIFGAMAWYGTRALYTGAPAPMPAPVPVPVVPPAPDAFALPRVRLATLALGAPRLRPAVLSLQELMAELQHQPEALPEARRFLTIQLDGLERIAQRLGAGAEPPATLETLLADMTRGSAQLRGRLRAAESEALEIQVKVLAERLRQEGFA